MPLGIITTLVREKRYGFIAPDDGSVDVYFRAPAVVGGTLDPLSEGDRVFFEIENAASDDQRGPRARLVAPYHHSRSGCATPVEDVAFTAAWSIAEKTKPPRSQAERGG